jgi:hypothetical protein
MKPAPCHPERQHLAKGLCSRCYWLSRYRDPVTGPLIKERNKQNHAEMKADPVVWDAHCAAFRNYRRMLQNDPEKYQAYRDRENARKRARRAAARAVR